MDIGRICIYFDEGEIIEMVRCFSFCAIFHLKYIVNQHISHQFVFYDMIQTTNIVYISRLFISAVYVNRCLNVGHAYEYFNVIRSRVDFILKFSIFKFTSRSSFLVPRSSDFALLRHALQSLW